LELNGDDVAGEDRLSNGSLTKDLSFSSGDIKGGVYVLKGQSVQNTSGAGSAQYKGYGGTGVARGGQGGVHKYFEFRSEGEGASNAKSWTASDYRYVP